ncbi:bifunctional protein-serine/threonine kinase/phosphatase [Candidatus Parabeggiatoa sp. HSG14]|uniref:bifunctional protein-serine/threonine kinase/phosphatase n=1 Tax=Candidatus Parabeggiatoa sp. HSG14 TaxID=3055593 RepID=UPI0025A855F4|nr:bifunctional protein-serine/threonine kinase/phosphatase [Thiotrichales bacterium HSG14]
MANILSITVGQHSEAGRKEKNQDAYGVLAPPEPLLTTKGVVAVIADGVSSSEAGGEASEYSVKGFLNDYFSTPESWTVKTAAQKILTALNRWLYGQGYHLYGTNKGLVTTLSVLVIKSTTAHLFHLGDTRIYRLRGTTLECLTQDHRVQISKDKEYLSRAMGIELHIEIDYRESQVEVRDHYIFTTDGIHGYISDKEIADIALEYRHDLNKACQLIVSEAYAKDSPDNLTCQIVRVDSLPSQDVDTFLKKLTDLPFPPPLSPGMHLDGYHILRELYASNRTQVYLALDADTQKKVVLKTPSVNFEDNPAYIDKFLHEEWVGKRLTHPHVMKVHEQKRHRQCLYYVAEHIQGQTLRQWIHDNPQPSLTEVRPMIEQIAAGLRAFHKMEMLHQDIKPENIMIDKHGTIKIIDFGSTKIAGLEEITTPLERINLLGTKNYTAPEYLRGYTGTTRSDIFSLGVMTYEMLTGQLPYSEGKTEKPTHRLNYTSACHYNPELPVWVDCALKKAVHPSPSRRYESLSEFLYDLSHPNPFPLRERNPVAFWRGTTVIMFIFNMLLLYLYLFK